MSFATIDWCKQAILLIVVICFYGNNALSCSALPINRSKLGSNDHQEQNYRKKLYNLLTQKISSCHEFNSYYKEVYSFETENFYIDICQLGSNFYYHRQSKTNPNNDIFTPAEVVFGGNIFRASHGKAIYFVGKDGDSYYSSVMQNNNEIVFEPELPPPSFTFSRNISNRQVNFSAANVSLIKLEGISYVSWKLKFSEANTADSLVCTNSKSYSDTNLKKWGTLLGKSPVDAHSYAIGNGHDFVYDDNFPDQASIKTKEGIVINLNIATPTEIIERICIQSIADNF